MIPERTSRSCRIVQGVVYMAKLITVPSKTLNLTQSSVPEAWFVTRDFVWVIAEKLDESDSLRSDPQDPMRGLPNLRPVF